MALGNPTSKNPHLHPGVPELTDSHVEKGIAPNIISLPPGSFFGLAFFRQADGNIGVACNPSMFIGADDRFIEQLCAIVRAEIKRVRTPAGTKPPTGDVQA